MRPLVSRTHRGRCKKQREGGQASPGLPGMPCVLQVTNLAIQPGLPGRGHCCPASRSEALDVSLWPGRVDMSHPQAIF